MSLDVIRFLDDHHISYRTSGTNCAKGGVVIKCPFCGEADPSEHMGWDLASGYWNCLRRPGHSGRRPHRLIMRLLGCSYDQADDLATRGRDLDTLRTRASRVFGHERTDDRLDMSGLQWPTAIRLLRPSGSGVHYTRYLERRGFRHRDIPGLVGDYGLRYCTSGYWRGRIIFPLMFEEQLVCWTGRSISDRATLRYLSLSKTEKEGAGAIAIKTPKELVWNFDDLNTNVGRALVIVEGPMDALKVDFYARKFGVRATCLFGTGITDDQATLLADLSLRYDRLVVLGDEGAWGNVMWSLDRLCSLRPRKADLPAGVEDPGAMTRRQVGELAHRV